MKNSFVFAGREMQEALASLCVLVVDDQKDIRIMERGILSDMGVTQIFEAGEGREALDFISSGTFSLVNFIICDWNMPGMNGIDFLRQIRRIRPSMPFLMATGRADKLSIMEAKAAGVSDYIRKPFSPRQLEEKIRGLIQSGE